MLMDILYVIGFLVCGFLAPIFAIMAWKVWKCPDSLWEEMKRTPYHKSYDVMQRFWNS